MFYIWLYVGITTVICGLIKLRSGHKQLAKYLDVLRSLKPVSGKVERVFGLGGSNFKFNFELNGKEQSGRCWPVAQICGLGDSDSVEPWTWCRPLSESDEVIVYLDPANPSQGCRTRAVPLEIVESFAAAVITLIIGIAIIWWAV